MEKPKVSAHGTLQLMCGLIHIESFFPKSHKEDNNLSFNSIVCFFNLFNNQVILKMVLSNFFLFHPVVTSSSTCGQLSHFTIFPSTHMNKNLELYSPQVGNA
jgi:hypothetical protein